MAFADSVGRRFVPDGAAFLYVSTPWRRLRLATDTQRLTYVGLVEAMRRATMARLLIVTLVAALAALVIDLRFVENRFSIALPIVGAAAVFWFGVRRHRAALADLVERWPVAAPPPGIIGWATMTLSPAALARMGWGAAVAAGALMSASLLGILLDVADDSHPAAIPLWAYLAGMVGGGYVLAAWFWHRFRST
jgi:hypothetical protein